MSSSPENPSLPYDLLLNIVARISRLYYPTLSNVSKSFRSLVASPELYKDRSLLGHTESCLYVCFNYDNPTWFTLCLKPNQRKKNEHSSELDNLISSLSRNSGYALVKVPITLSPRVIDHSSLVAVGSNIYNIGGYKNLDDCEFSSSVWIMDCVSHTWREAPSLPVEPNPLSLSVSVSDRKIYVAGQFKKGDFYKDLCEVFDTKAEIWDPEPIPFRAKDIFFRELHMFLRDNYCEIDDVCFSFCVYNRVFKWYDAKERSWRILKGLVGLPDLSCVKLANYGGKIAVLWEQSSDGCCKEIWLAVIQFERQSSDILGKVEWFDHVLTVPLSYCFPNVVATTV